MTKYVHFFRINLPLFQEHQYKIVWNIIEVYIMLHLFYKDEVNSAQP